MSFYNIVIAFSNIAAYPALEYSYKNIFTFIPLLFVSTFSFISHIFESHKHGLYGFGMDHKYSYFLNRLDVFGSIWLTLRILYLYYQKYGFNLSPFFSDPYLPMLTIFAFVFSILSEHQYWMGTSYNPNVESLKRLYLITHCLWHILIFWSIQLQLQLLF